MKGVCAAGQHLRLESAGDQASAVVVDPPDQPPLPSVLLASQVLVSFSVDARLLRISLTTNAKGRLTGGTGSAVVHYGYSDLGAGLWSTPPADVDLQSPAVPEEGVLCCAELPVEPTHVGVCFVIRVGSQWIKDVDGRDFYVPFQWRLESFALGDAVLVAAVFRRTVRLSWRAGQSCDTAENVRYSIVYPGQQGWSDPAADVALSAGIVWIEVPPKGVGVRAKVLDASGGVLTDKAGGHVFISCVSEHDQRESESFLEFPLAISVPTASTLALSRRNPFWVYPRVVPTFAAVPAETLFMAAQLEDSRVLVAIATVDPARRARSSFRGSREGVVVRVEASDLAFAPGASVAVLAVGWTLGTAARRAYRAAAARLGTALRQENMDLRPTLLQGLGWCSWDGLGVDVNAAAVINTVRDMKQAGIDIRWVVVDDGWQDVHDRLLRSFGVAKKFGDMKQLISSLKDEHGVHDVLVWHTIIGYWDGVAADNTCDGEVAVRRLRSRFSEGLMTNNTDEMRRIWIHDYSLPLQPEALFGPFYEQLRSLGVTGVKVDGQGLLEGFGGRGQSRVAWCSRFRAAMEAAARDCFAGNVINCMSCGNDAVYCSDEGASSVVWRTSDDHAFHNAEENAWQIANHIWSNAANCLWLGEHFVPDWDMFRSNGEFASVNAAARAISGGPIYLSDSPHAPHNGALVAQLVDSRSTPLVCGGAGRACDRSAFENPLSSKSAYYVWNENPVNVVVAAFNLNVEPAVDVRADPSPSDAESRRLTGSGPHAEFGVHAFREGFLGIFRRDQRIGTPIELQPLQFELFNFAPVTHLACGARLCVLGLAGKMNPGAAIRSVTAVSDCVVDVHLAATGEIEFWSDRPASACLLRGGTAVMHRQRERGITSVGPIAERDSAFRVEFQMEAAEQLDVAELLQTMMVQRQQRDQLWQPTPHASANRSKINLFID